MPTTQNSNQERPPNTPPSSPWWRFSWWWQALLVALLIPNYWAGSHAMKEPSPVRVPYSPFLQQVRAGNVVDITSKGTAIQGTFAHPES